MQDLRPKKYLDALLAHFREHVYDSTCMVGDFGKLWLRCHSEVVSVCLRFSIPSANRRNYTWPVEEVLSFYGLEILDDDDNEVFDVALRYLSTDWIDFAFEAAEKSKAFTLAAEATWLRKIEEYEAACSRMSG